MKTGLVVLISLLLALVGLFTLIAHIRGPKTSPFDTNIYLIDTPPEVVGR
jgi:hypothetical protein